MMNLAWGHSVAVRQAFLDVYGGDLIVFSHSTLSQFNYPEHEGDPELVEITKQIIKYQTGLEYDHVFLVNGATGGVVITLRAYAEQGMKFCRTRQAPHYGLYPGMIATAGLNQVQEGNVTTLGNTVTLLDIPSNPLGLMDWPIDLHTPTVIDGVYLNHVYAPVFWSIPHHEVMIGSYSKLTGLNGIRLGWIATNDGTLAKNIGRLVTNEYCGLDTASTTILKKVLHNFNWPLFDGLAKNKLDNNREEWSKLERFFDGNPVTEIGMFHYGPLDSKAQEIFRKAGIVWTAGSAMGTTDDFARFNLGQDNLLIRQAVKEILKTDQANGKPS